MVTKFIKPPIRAPKKRKKEPEPLPTEPPEIKPIIIDADGNVSFFLSFHFFLPFSRSRWGKGAGEVEGGDALNV